MVYRKFNMADPIWWTKGVYFGIVDYELFNWFADIQYGGLFFYGTIYFQIDI